MGRNGWAGVGEGGKGWLGGCFGEEIDGGGGEGRNGWMVGGEGVVMSGLCLIVTDIIFFIQLSRKLFRKLNYV